MPVRFSIVHITILVCIWQALHKLQETNIKYKYSFT